jgi:hypothetical protein
MLTPPLNNKWLSANPTPKTSLAFIIFILLILAGLSLGGSGCGKRTAPVPPVEKIAQRVQIRGFQRGGQINLSWTLPAQNPSVSSLTRVARVDIYRLAQPSDAPHDLTEEEFAARSTLIASIPIQNETGLERPMVYADQLEFAGQPVKLRYAIRFVNASGQKAAFSNFLLIEPTPSVAAAPTLGPITVSQEAIFLRWTQPERNLNGAAATPANVLGYNIYRLERSEAKADSRAEPELPSLNAAPVRQTEFADRNFEFGRNYAYFVRAVSVGANGQPVESADSNKVEISPRDTFPPAAPSAVTIAAAPGNISIFFAANQEPDVSGYKIYRSVKPDSPKSDWTNLTDKPLPTNTFQDLKVESGVTYFYFVTAVDKFGNESQPSEVVSETAP